MKKSMLYYMAMVSVIESEYAASDKLEILDALMSDRRLALFAEESEAKA